MITKKVDKFEVRFWEGFVWGREREREREKSWKKRFIVKKRTIKRSDKRQTE